MTNQALIKKADIQKIAEQGAQIYEKIKENYEPRDNGKFLAIDIDTQNTYLGTTSTEALDKAKKDHPQKVFYVVKIGFNFAEMLANSASRSWGLFRPK